MMPHPLFKNFGDKTQWIKVFADGSGDYTTLTAAFAAHQEAGARFLIKGALQEPDGADSGWLSSAIESYVDPRILSPAAGQHLHFVKGASLYLGVWRMLAFRANDISIRTEGPIEINVGQSPSYAQTAIFIGNASGLDFTGCEFNVVATRAVVAHTPNVLFIRFGALEYSKLGDWSFHHVRAVTHDLGGTTIANIKFGEVPAYLRHCELNYRLKTAEQTAVGWTTTAVYGFAMRIESAPARSYDSCIINLDICPLPSASYQFPLSGTSSDMQSAGFAGCKLFLACRSSSAAFSSTTGNVFNQAY